MDGSPIQPEKALRKSVPTTSARTWGPLAAVLLTVFAYFASQVIGGVLVFVAPMLSGWSAEKTQDWLSASAYGQFIFILIVEVVMLGIIWKFLKSRKARPADIGLKRPRLIDIGYALSGFAVYIIAYILLLQIVQHLVPSINLNQKQEIGFSTTTTGLPLIAIFLSLVVLPPLTEEIVTRGFLYSGLRSKLPKVVAAIVTSIIFASAHLQAGSGNALLWVAAIDTFVLSLVLIYMRDKTDSLWASILLHALKNGIAFTSLFILHLA